MATHPPLAPPKSMVDMLAMLRLCIPILENSDGALRRPYLLELEGASLSLTQTINYLRQFIIDELTKTPSTEKPKASSLSLKNEIIALKTKISADCAAGDAMAKHNKSALATLGSELE